MSRISTDDTVTPQGFDRSSISFCRSSSICSRPRSRSASVVRPMMSRSAVCAAHATARAVVLHLERRLLGVVDHPEQHRIDIDRHRVGGQRLLRRKTGRDGPLIDHRRHAIDERHDPEQPRAAQADVAAEAQHDRALPLLRDLRRRRQQQPDHRGDDDRDRVAQSAQLAAPPIATAPEQNRHGDHVQPGALLPDAGSCVRRTDAMTAITCLPR